MNSIWDIDVALLGIYPLTGDDCFCGLWERKNDDNDIVNIIPVGDAEEIKIYDLFWKNDPSTDSLYPRPLKFTEADASLYIGVMSATPQPPNIKISVGVNIMPEHSSKLGVSSSFSIPVVITPLFRSATAMFSEFVADVLITPIAYLRNVVSEFVANVLITPIASINVGIKSMFNCAVNIRSLFESTFKTPIWRAFKFVNRLTGKTDLWRRR